LYDEPFKHKVETIPIEEILANRSSAYDFIDFDKQELEILEVPMPIYKQETTSEGFHRIYNSMDFTEFDFISFKIGVEWQQQQDKNKYSEEDLKTAFLDGWQLREEDLPFPKAKNKWFKEFTKKS
jgi:hypothetical protein